MAEPQLTLGGYAPSPTTVQNKTNIKPVKTAVQSGSSNLSTPVMGPGGVNTLDKYNTNKNFMLEQQKSGKATPEQLAWLTKNNLGTGATTPTSTTPTAAPTPAQASAQAPSGSRERMLQLTGQVPTPSGGPAMGPGGVNTLEKHNTNRDFMIEQYKAGTATPEHIDWLTRNGYIGGGNAGPTTGGMAADGGQFHGDANDPTNTGNRTAQPGYVPPGASANPATPGGNGTSPGAIAPPGSSGPGYGVPTPENPTGGTPGGGDLTRGPYSGGKAIAESTTRPDGSVQSGYIDTRGNEFRATATDMESQDPMEIERMNAASAAENARTVGEAEMSGYQLDQLLQSDSPLMQLAAQRGIDLANIRGLSNSSMAAGAAMREMTQQMTPFAMQQAEAQRSAEAQNQTLESSRREQDASREQQASAINAGAENQATSQEFATEAERDRFNAGQTTDVSKTNAAMANELLNADRQRYYGASMQQLAGDQDYAKQQLASQTGVDIANIEGQFKQLISENDTAARMFGATYDSIGDIMANQEIRGDEASEKVNYLVATMENMMNTLLAFDSVDLTPSGASGSGNDSSFDSGGGGGGQPTIDYSQIPLAQL